MARRFEVPMLVVALLVIPTLVIQESELGRTWQLLAQVLDWLIWGAFATELLVMLLVVPDRLRWLRENPLEVMVVVLTPPFLPTTLQAARLLRLLRVLRLLLIIKRARRVFSTEGLRYAALILFVVVVGGGTAFAAVEPRQHISAWDGVWWAVETVTTVGYGDIYPKTTAGRMIGIVVMASGIGFVALLTGAMAQRFLQGEDEDAPPETELMNKLEEVSKRLEEVSGEVSELREELRRREEGGR